MIKYLFLPLICVSLFSNLRAAEPSDTLVFDMINEPTLPSRFRKVDGPIKDPTVNREGLSTLKASGSGQFSEKSFGVIKTALGNPKKLLVIDLRDESHGFINGNAISWYADQNWGNKQLNDKEAAQQELKRLASVPVGGTITIYTILEKTPEGGILRTAPNELKVESVSNEETFVKSHGADYIRLRVLDHTAPDIEAAKAFEKIVKTLPDDVWLHLHCRAGGGRTTTFLCLYDIIKNGKKVPLRQILQRQYLLGGGDLVASAGSDSWKGPYAQERLVFLQNFYNRVVNGESN